MYNVYIYALLKIHADGVRASVFTEGTHQKAEIYRIRRMEWHIMKCAKWNLFSYLIHIYWCMIYTPLACDYHLNDFLLYVTGFKLIVVDSLIVIEAENWKSPIRHRTIARGIDLMSYQSLLQVVNSLFIYCYISINKSKLFSGKSLQTWHQQNLSNF